MPWKSPKKGRRRGGKAPRRFGGSGAGAEFEDQNALRELREVRVNAAVPQPALAIEGVD